jgi:ankyrin repeat protein
MSPLTRLLSLILLASPQIARAQLPDTAKRPIPVVETPAPAAAELASLAPSEKNARLRAAVKGDGDIALIATLLAAGADPLDQLPGGEVPFIVAIKAGRIDYARAILAARPGIAKKPWPGDLRASTVGNVALYHALERGQTAFALYLLKEEQVARDSWRPDVYGSPPSALALAIKHWDTELVRFMVETGWDFAADLPEGFFILLDEHEERREHEAAAREMRARVALRSEESRKKLLVGLREQIARSTDAAAKARMERNLAGLEKSFAKEPKRHGADAPPDTLEKIRLLASFRPPGKTEPLRVNDTRLDGSSPLALAIKHDWPEIVAILSAAGAKLEAGLIDRKRIIDYVADKPDMLRALAGAPAGMPGDAGVDGAEYVAAIRRGNTALLDETSITPALLAYRDPHKKSALHHAIEASNDALALRLMEAGADIETPSVGGQTPLVYAAFQRRHEIMRALLARHARPDGSAPGIPYPPLIAAAATGDSEAVRMLLAAGANPDRRDPNDVPVLVSAAMHSPSVETVRLLVEAGARLDVAIDDIDVGPLEATFQKDHADTLAYLLDKHAPWFWAHRGEHSPLLAAARLKAWKCARLLLDRGERDERALAFAEDPAFKAALEDVMQAAGSTTLDDAELWPAICADKEHWRARVDAHLAHGGNVNYRAKDWTPLLRAIETGNLEFVRHLLAKGADPKVHPLERYENDPATLEYLYMGRFHPRGLSAAEWEAYRAALIRLLVPLEPSHGFTDYEWHLSRAVTQKSWAEAEAYVAAGVATEEAVQAARKTSELTDEERARALKLMSSFP